MPTRPMPNKLLQPITPIKPLPTPQHQTISPPPHRIPILTRQHHKIHITPHMIPSHQTPHQPLIHIPTKTKMIRTPNKKHIIQNQPPHTNPITKNHNTIIKTKPRLQHRTQTLKTQQLHTSQPLRTITKTNNLINTTMPQKQHINITQQKSITINHHNTIITTKQSKPNTISLNNKRMKIKQLTKPTPQTTLITQPRPPIPHKKTRMMTMQNIITKPNTPIHKRQNPTTQLLTNKKNNTLTNTKLPKPTNNRTTKNNNDINTQPIKPTNTTNKPTSPQNITTITTSHKNNTHTINSPNKNKVK